MERAQQPLTKWGRSPIVLKVGRYFTPPDPIAAQEAVAFQEGWMHQLQAHLAGLSTRGKQAIVEDSNHGIPFQGRTLWSTPSRRSSLRLGKSRAATRESRSEKRAYRNVALTTVQFPVSQCEPICRARAASRENAEDPENRHYRVFRALPRPGSEQSIRITSY